MYQLKKETESEPFLSQQQFAVIPLLSPDKTHQAKVAQHSILSASNMTCLLGAAKKAIDKHKVQTWEELCFRILKDLLILYLPFDLQ